MRNLFFTLCICACAFPAFAEVTPADFVVSPGMVTSITCAYTGSEKLDASGMLYPPQQGEYNYKVYLPTNYSPDHETGYPVLFIMSPGGGASPSSYTAGLNSRGWIGIGLIEAKNGPWSPIIGNFLAAHDDAVQRFKIKADEKYATGFSGGARGSSVFAQIRPGFRGVLLCGAGFFYDETGRHKNVYGVRNIPNPFAVCMLMGQDDSNGVEVDLLPPVLPSWVAQKIERHEGGHVNAPRELIEAGLDWISSQPATATAPASAAPETTPAQPAPAVVQTTVDPALASAKPQADVRVLKKKVGKMERVELVHKTKGAYGFHDYTQWSYGVTVAPRSAQPLEVGSVRVAYRIYWKDDTGHKGDKNKVCKFQPGTWEPTQPVSTAKPGIFDTDIVKLGRTTMKPGWHHADGSTSLKDELEGIWVKVFINNELAGQKIDPPSLVEQGDW